MLHEVKIVFPMRGETKVASMPLDKLHKWVSDSLQGKVPAMHSTHFTNEIVRENGKNFTETVLKDVEKRPVAFIWVEQK